MSAVEDLIYNKEGKQQEILLFLHDLMISIPNVEAKVRWKLPFYFRKSWICYTNVLKNGNIELCFMRAIELSNASGILNMKGRRQIGGIEISSLDDIPMDALQEVLQEALLLDDTVPYSPPWSKKKKK